MEQVAEEAVNPMILKKRLAREIVGQFHSAHAARDAESHFEKVVQGKEAPDEMAELAFSFSNPLNGPNSDLVKAKGRGPIFVAPGDDWHEVLPPSLLIIDLVGVLVRTGMASSRQESKRLLTQLAVKVGGYKETGGSILVNPTDRIEIAPNTLIKVGKRRWIKIVDADTK
jgi:tyrosyl-tRNA synthetase